MKYFLFIIFVLSAKLHAAKTHTLPIIPGIIESVESSIKIQNELLSELYLEATKVQLTKSDWSKIVNIKIDPIFLSNIIFNSDKRFFHLVKFNTCSFYSLIKNDFLKISSGKLNYLIINFSFNGEHILRKAVVTNEQYLNHVYKSSCFKNIDLQRQYSKESFVKRIQSLVFLDPSPNNSCTKIYQDWLKNKDTPHLCRIDDYIRSIKKPNHRKSIVQSLGSYRVAYISNLCKNLDSSERFCNHFSSNDFWHKTFKENKNLHLLENRCKTLIKGFTSEQTIECVKKLVNNSDLCHFNGASAYTHLTPKPNCANISQALHNSKYRAKMTDCPAKIGNEAITNISRIIGHFDSTQITENNCVAFAYNELSSLIHSYGHPTNWHYKICHKEIFENGVKCLPYAPGNFTSLQITKHPNLKTVSSNIENEGLSESLVLRKVMSRLVPMNKTDKCEVTTTKEFRPLRPKYQRGCYAVYQQKHCIAENCDRKIFYDGRENTNIIFLSGFINGYFPYSLKQEKKSLINTLSNKYIYKKSQMENFTQVKSIFERHPQTIIHGVACAEDLLPYFFSGKTINACKPLPFIILGQFRKHSTNFVTFISAIDNINSPRILTWNRVFHSIKKFTNLFPIKLWNLYAIY
ncbi:hypothetical protein OAB57_00765 [Bacteriovoracaceae bacterium]|nr:hypothetical protein [Bacteriovoracaceae bacterium]